MKKATVHTLGCRGTVISFAQSEKGTVPAVSVPPTWHEYTTATQHDPHPGYQLSTVNCPL